LAEPATLEATTAILLQQYKMAEERRSEFGRQFMQTTGFAVPLFAAAVGLARPSASLLRVVCGIGGPFFLGLAVLAYRLGQRQDECEQTLSEIEGILRHRGHSDVVTLHPSHRRFGARTILVLFLALVGVILIIFAAYGVSFASPGDTIAL